MKSCFEDDTKCEHVLKADAYRDLCFFSSIEKKVKNEKGEIETISMENLTLDGKDERKLAFFTTSSGIVGMPGKTFPFKVDAISRPWYERAVHSRAFAVSVYQDFLWGNLVATISKSRDSSAG